MLLAIRRLLMSPVAACVCKWSLIFHTLLFSYKTFKFLFTSHKLQLFNTPKLFFHSCNLMLPKKSFLFSLYNLFDFITLLYVQKSVNLVSLAEISLFYPLDLIHNAPWEKQISAKKTGENFLFFSFFSTLVIMNTITEKVPTSTVTNKRMMRDEKILLQESCFMLQSMKARLLWRHRFSSLSLVFCATTELLVLWNF